MVGKLMGEERGGEEWEKEFVNILKILQWCCDGWGSDDVRESGSRKREESNFQLFIFLALKPQSIPLLLDCIEAFCPQQNCAGKKKTLRIIQLSHFSICMSCNCKRSSWTVRCIFSFLTFESSSDQGFTT